MSSILSNSASLDHASSGLDRAYFNAYDKADCHITAPLQQQAPNSSSGDGGSDDTGDDQREARESPRTFASVRRVSAEHAPKSPAVPALAPAAAHDGDDERLFHPAPEHKGPQVKELLHNPVDTVSSLLHGASGAKMADVVDSQVIAHGANVNLVRVYDKAADTDNKDERQLALKELEDLKKARQDKTIRRIPPLNLQRPQKKDFRIRDQKEEDQINWAMYGEHLARFYARHYGDQYIDESPALPSANEEAINTSLERLLMTSSPRRIYRWDDPMQTGVYLASYLFLWAFDHLLSAALLGLIWLVLERHFTLQL